MYEPLVRVFDVVEGAQRAREALLADGFDGDAITINVTNDEAGPVQGNFTVGNLPVESDRHTYDRNYAPIQQVSQCIITVSVADPALVARAEAVLKQYGAHDLVDPASGAQRM